MTIEMKKGERMTRRYFGLWISWVMVLGTLVLFALAKIDGGFVEGFGFLFFSQLVSLVGIALLSLSMFLSSRWRKLDLWFGGFDKVYRQHHIAGVLSFVAIVHHPLFLAVEALPSVELAQKYLWLSNTTSYNWGVGALYLMILLLILTILVNLPYHLWKLTHDYMGLAFLFASIHILTVSSDVSLYMPLRVWVMGLLVIGFWAIFYKKIWYQYWEEKYWYRVSRLEIKNEVVDVYLRPEDKKIVYTAGQFVFACFERFGGESHPFSVASGSGAEEIRLGVKKLGDQTNMYGNLKIGDRVRLWGGYGQFWQVPETSNKDLVWMAGGIGITPFLGMVEDELKRATLRNVDLFYCAKTREEMVYWKEIENKVAGVGRFSLHEYCSVEKGRINGDEVLKMSGNNIDKKFLLCGPIKMMNSLTEDLAKLGVKRKNIIFEDFNFK